MQNVFKIKEDVFWVGGNDRRITLFENAFPVPEGISYNSYMIMDEKTTLIDTVDQSISEQFIDNIEYLLQGKPLDYLVINHMEPDHCASIKEILLRYPKVTIVANIKQVDMIANFFDIDVQEQILLVKENDVLSIGRHELTFVFAPMVHWPEVMVTYDKTDKILFSADAFGKFGAINGNLIANPKTFETTWLEQSRRYYSNIVGKYGVPVQTLLKKAQTLDIDMICPLHGSVITEEIGQYIDKYQKWSQYIPENKAVMIAYASVYGHTQNAVDILASKLVEKGIEDICIYDVSSVDTSYIISDVFRCSHLVFASITYNGGIFSKMENLLHEISAHGVKNRTIGLIENGSWAAASAKKMAEIVSGMKNITILESTVKIKSAVKPNQMEELESLACEIAASIEALKL